ncbi:acyl esterase [Methylobacterium pseudosasicola]|uniref:Glycosyltransferase like family protein n=1 Tax=Methylobacterium pseudosasicola TaxID=582667 RepID=A0A1I4UGN4_9HYPH|nr:acyl esterase [Methylobacterium pseudosasicola]SFM88085.1 hypothetical protein SAMN05192568_10708 [Methylobacterium pseudosasicola]
MMSSAIKLTVEGGVRFEFEQSELPLFSICTLVTKIDEYNQFLSSAFDAGFSLDRCEFFYADNTAGNSWDARHALRRFIHCARGRYVILCHQDLVFKFDDYSDLVDRLAELTACDPNWGVCGNAGADNRGSLVVRISDPHGSDRMPAQPLPAKVVSLDENFLVIRSDSGITFPRDLHGFHWYGSDACIVARTLGWEAYVINFHIYHKSGGSTSGSYRDEGRSFSLKYSELANSRWHYVVTGHSLFISPYVTWRLAAKVFLKIRQLLGRFRRLLRTKMR